MQLLSKVHAVSPDEVVGRGRPLLLELGDDLPHLISGHTDAAKQHRLPVDVAWVLLRRVGRYACPPVALAQAKGGLEAPLSVQDLNAAVEGAEVSVHAPAVQDPLGHG